MLINSFSKHRMLIVLFKLYGAVQIRIVPCPISICVKMQMHSMLICNVNPLTPNLYIVKLGFTGVKLFSYFCTNSYIVCTR